MSFPDIPADRYTLERDGVRLRHALTHRLYPKVERPIVLIHGWCCDHRFFAHQISHFWSRSRVFAPDLRGHGESDAPRQGYSVASFAGDVAWQCDQLGIRNALIVGHSMGGSIALELAARRPDIAAGVAMIDAVLHPPAPVVEMLRQVGRAFDVEPAEHVIRNVAGSLFLETDDRKRRIEIIATMARAPSHVAMSAFREHLFEYAPPGAADLSGTALAYIASTGLSDVGALRLAYPGIQLSATLGVGHFSPLEAPAQVNAMLDRFLSLLPATDARGAAGPQIAARA